MTSGAKLRHTAELLLGLADLAERASLRAWPLICLVLWALRPAEAAARRYVIDIAELCGVHPAGLDRHDLLASGDSAVAALRLAAQLRTLADWLLALAELPDDAFTDAPPLPAFTASLAAAKHLPILDGPPAAAQPESKAPDEPAHARRRVNDTS